MVKISYILGTDLDLLNLIKKTMNRFFLICALICSSLAFGQSTENIDELDSLKMYESDPVPIYSRNYMRKYNHYKRLILKVYPYALYASDVLYELEATSEDITRHRKKKRFYKTAYKDLKSDFKYVFRDMYTSEGRMLMKLVHRETGMTVYEIAETYRGKRSATVFDLMGKIWDQDVRIKWDPNGQDKIGEHVIRDIESGLINFNQKVVKIDKEQYRENKKEHRKRLRENKKRRRKMKRECSKKKRRQKRKNNN